MIAFSISNNKKGGKCSPPDSRNLICPDIEVQHRPTRRDTMMVEILVINREALAQQCHE